jgi:hypothetical protein
MLALVSGLRLIVVRCFGSRFDVNRLVDGSVIKEEYLRLSGGDSAEY